MKRVSIVVTTYKRNKFLIRVVHQIEGWINQYKGSNFYEVGVADSDRKNPIARSLRKLNYCVNPGRGFDDNLLHFWKTNASRYDYIFSISDDDLFMLGVNPLYLLDAAISVGADATLFNHRSYLNTESGALTIGSTPYFHEFAMGWEEKTFWVRLLTLIPGHVGMLYSSKFLAENFDKIACFRKTLHLYIVPLLIAGLNHKMVFLNYSLCLFHAEEEKTDGAWSHLEGVMNGLALFLKQARSLLPEEDYRILEEGFFREYFGAESWLRKKFPPDAAVRTESEIIQYLSTH